MNFIKDLVVNDTAVKAMLSLMSKDYHTGLHKLTEIEVFGSSMIETYHLLSVDFHKMIPGGFEYMMTSQCQDGDIKVQVVEIILNKENPELSKGVEWIDETYAYILLKYSGFDITKQDLTQIDKNTFQLDYNNELTHLRIDVDVKSFEIFRI